MNRRPHRCERCALPAELQPHYRTYNSKYGKIYLQNAHHEREFEERCAVFALLKPGVLPRCFAPSHPRQTRPRYSSDCRPAELQPHYRTYNARYVKTYSKFEYYSNYFKKSYTLGTGIIGFKRFLQLFHNF